MDLLAAKVIGAGLATMGMLGVGIGLGNLFSNLLQAVGRNPGAKKDLFGLGIFGAALTEFIAILIFLVVVLILFVVK